MNRIIKEATIKAFHYPDLESLKVHVLTFVCAFNFAKHLKALRKTPYQTIVEAWQTNPVIFKTNPRHLIPGLYILATGVCAAINTTSSAHGITSATSSSSTSLRVRHVLSFRPISCCLFMLMTDAIRVP